MRECKGDGQGQRKEMKIRNRKEKKKLLSKAQEMSWLLRNIRTRKELGQIRMSREITKHIKGNKKLSDIQGIMRHED